MNYQSANRRTRIALATCEAERTLTNEDRILVQQLRTMGFRAEPLVWTSDADYQDTLVVIRSCWDYHLQPARFLQWTESVGRKGGKLLNPASTVRWNHDKRYLRELQAKGVRVAPTVWVESNASTTLQQIVDETGWQEIVVKPAISATAWQTFRRHRDDVHRSESSFTESVRGGCVLVQQFLTDILVQGEWSFVFFNGIYSHAALKRPAQSDFRVQREFGGFVDCHVRPSPRLIDAAIEALRQCPDAASLYARVDGIETNEGLVIVEIEQIEPALFLDDQTTARFSHAILARCDFV